MTTSPLQEAKPVRRKYRNTPTVVDGVRFDSKKEARRWGELQLLQRAGEIRNLQRQQRYPLEVNDRLIATYVSDFTYFEKAGIVCDGEDGFRLVVEDSKGVQTPEFKLKAKLMKAIHGIEVRLS